MITLSPSNKNEPDKTLKAAKQYLNFASAICIQESDLKIKQVSEKPRKYQRMTTKNQISSKEDIMDFS